MKTLRSLLVCGALASVSALLLAQSDQPVQPAFSIASGLDYSRGDYGFATDTEVLSVPLDLSYEGSSWVWRANFSHLRIKGPATIVGDGGVARPTASSESGVGDTYLGLTFRPNAYQSGLHLEPTVRVKLPTASESRGLGTGETDVYGQLDLYQTFGEVTPFATVGYRVLGDNTTYQLDDGMYASAGAHFRTSPATILTASASWGQRMFANGSNTSDAMVAVTHDVSARWRMMGYATKGFTSASPDFGAGARLTYRF
jgi:hypothetical protein